MVSSCERGNEPSIFRKIRRISSVAENLLAFQEGLCPTELISYDGVRVALVVQHAKRMRHFMLSSVACLSLTQFSTLS